MRRKYPNRPSEIDDYARLRLGLIKDPWRRSRQWANDMVTIARLTDIAKRQAQFEEMALLMGAKIR